MRERERWGRRERKEKRYVCDKSAGGLIVEIGIEREREREGGGEKRERGGEREREGVVYTAFKFNGENCESRSASASLKRGCGLQSRATRALSRYVFLRLRFLTRLIMNANTRDACVKLDICLRIY